MYPYHNKIKQRIKNGELVGYHYENKDNINEKLILVFSKYPYTRTISPHRYEEYKNILNNLDEGEIYGKSN